MRTGKAVVILLILLPSLFFLPASCRRNPDVPAEETVSGPVPEEPARILAESTVDRLRVRALPYLDEEIVTFLSEGESVVVESRTEWTQQLDGMTSSWYFIRTESDSGWTYGGFLDFAGSDSMAVPVNPALPEPVESPDLPIEGPIDIAELPEILLPVFGMEGDAPTMPGEEGTIGYDPVYGDLVIPFRPGADSGLADFAAGNTSLRMVAEHYSGQRFEYTYSSEDLSLFSETWGFLTENIVGEAILLPFYRLASLEGGAWEFYAFAGNENWPAAIGKADISPAAVSVVRSENPNPMIDSPQSTVNPGDTVFCFGRENAGEGFRQVALYHDTSEYREGKVLLRPEVARRVKVNSKGQWQTAISLGSGMPYGRYWVATGDPIEGLEDVKLFITSLNIEPSSGN